MPRAAITSATSTGTRLPLSVRPAEATRGLSTWCSARLAKSAAAIGERQMFAVQTKRTRTARSYRWCTLIPGTSLT